MIRAAICDDEAAILDVLRELISGEFEKQGAEISVDCFTSGGEFLNAHKNNPFDAVFLDIRMPDMNGFDVAAELRRHSEKTRIIFITTENALVYDSFSFQPFDFIPKTVPAEFGAEGSSKFLENRVASVVARLLAQFTAAKTVTLPLPYNRTITVNIADIQLIQSVRNYAEYVVAGREPVRVRAKLDDIGQELDGRVFARPHKSFIINMSFVKDIDRRNMVITLKSGALIPISKAYKREFEAAYIGYLSGGD
ncbi:MAG: LytTR family DNA-binding domain-containing protein [Oscillospiraceae bacterium]|nr:LytTR family DNA-binding domain-containing protein [Oscillospiraceae bacterium]